MFRRRDPEAEERLRRALERIREECDPYKRHPQLLGACIGKVLAQEGVELAWIFREPLGEKLRRWLGYAWRVAVLVWGLLSMGGLGPLAVLLMLRDAGLELVGGLVMAGLCVFGIFAFLYILGGGGDP